MEQNHETKIYFAIRKETNQLVHISEMIEKDRGMACECVCANCGRPLVAKLGHGGKIRHFAHLADKSVVECSADKANESALHKMAKELICKSTYIWLPELTIAEQNDPDRNKNDNEQQKPMSFGKKTRFQYQSVQMEVPFNGFKPDICLIQKSGKLFLIEIAVTHHVDEEKHQRIKTLQIPTIEIKITDFLKEYKADGNESKDELIEKLKEALIESTENKIWIYHPREKEGIQKLCERNRKLEEEYQQNQIRTRKALQEQERWEKQKEQWKQEQANKREQIDIKVEQLHADEMSYLQYRDELKQTDEVVLNRINNLGICDLKFSRVSNIPFFLDIPVFGEIAFKCDRRIWQTILFERRFYQKNIGRAQVFYPWNFGNIDIPKTYCYLAGKYENLINQQFVYIWKKNGKVKFKENDLLCKAIEEYLRHLAALGFMDICYYYYPCNNGLREYNVIHNTLNPQRIEYAVFLKEILKNFPDTNDPFGYIQEKWLQTGHSFKSFKKFRNFDTLLYNK